MLPQYSFETIQKMREIELENNLKNKEFDSLLNNYKSKKVCDFVIGDQIKIKDDFYYGSWFYEHWDLNSLLDNRRYDSPTYISMKHDVNREMRSIEKFRNSFNPNEFIDSLKGKIFIIKDIVFTKEGMYFDQHVIRMHIQDENYRSYYITGYEIEKTTHD
jgi:hypothetical protein